LADYSIANQMYTHHSGGQAANDNHRQKTYD